MDDIKLLDSAFQSNKTPTYHATLQLGRSNYTIAVLDITKKKYIALKKIHFSKISETEICQQAASVFQREELLKRKYKSFSFLFPSRKSTLVPQELFQENNINVFFKFNHVLLPNEKVNYSFIPRLKAYNIFAYPSCLEEIVAKRKAGGKVANQLTAFLNEILAYHPKVNKDKKNANPKKPPFIAVNVFTNFFDIAVIDKGRLILSNSFHYKDANDFLYFILYIYKQLKLETENVSLLLTGNIHSKSKEYQLAKQYINTIQFIELNRSFTYSSSFKSVDIHPFTNIFNHYLCG